MIITRSPLRISLGGGGTDLPSYYREHGGFAVAAAIDKYVYITIHQTFAQELIVKYSRLERVTSVDQIAHPIIREALRLVDISNPYLELTSMADIPAGTGLGTSGSFTTALLKALHTYQKNIIPNADLAAQACDIELNKLGEPIGKQDQYIAAIGGVTAFTFHPDGRVDYRPVRLAEETLVSLSHRRGPPAGPPPRLDRRDIERAPRADGHAQRDSPLGTESRPAADRVRGILRPDRDPRGPPAPVGQSYIERTGWPDDARRDGRDVRPAP